MSWNYSSDRVSVAGGRWPQKGPDSALEIRKAAQQFEALLIGMFLRQTREAAIGLDPDAQDGATQTALEIAEERMAEVIASQGGLGLANLMIRGLQGRSIPDQYCRDPYPEYAVSSTATGSVSGLPLGAPDSEAKSSRSVDAHASQPSSNVRRSREASASGLSFGCK